MAKKCACACNARHAGQCVSAEVKARTQEQIAHEYGRVAAEIGDLEYRRTVGIPATLAELYAKAKALNLEANEAAKAKEKNP